MLLVLASFSGVVAYAMGFVSWASITEADQSELDRWGNSLETGSGVPAFLSYEVVLNPGKFLIVLGALAVAALLLLVPAYRRALPIVAVLASGTWLALLSAALVLPPFVTLGAGAIVSLIFGFLQAAALVAAAFFSGVGR